jgi:hypothetical protein
MSEIRSSVTNLWETFHAYNNKQFFLETEKYRRESETTKASIKELRLLESETEIPFNLDGLLEFLEEFPNLISLVIKSPHSNNYEIYDTLVI